MNIKSLILKTILVISAVAITSAIAFSEEESDQKSKKQYQNQVSDDTGAGFAVIGCDVCVKNQSSARLNDSTSPASQRTPVNKAEEKESTK